MKTHDVTFRRSDFEQAMCDWEVVDDVMKQSRVKAAGTKYLPMPMPKDTSPENKARYEQYLTRATLFGATQRTLQSLIGAAFRKVPSLNAPDDLAYMATDIDGNGLSIYQQSQMVLKDVLKRGRHGLLVDYPQVTGPLSKAQLAEGGIRATTASISARNVVNWRTRKIGADYKLDLIVILESVEEPTPDGFGLESIEQYRVLRLTDGYTQEVWRKSAEDEEWHLFVQPFYVLDGAGRKWDEIPFTFAGASNNDPAVDDSPLLSLAEKEIAHYQVSADCRHSAYMTGQAQPVFTGLTEEWRDWLQKQGIYFGSSAPILLPQDADALLLQTQGNTQAEREREYIEKMINALGARLIQPGSAIKTATEAQSENEDEHSVLSLAVSNVSEAYVRCMKWMARFMGVTGDVEYAINQEFTRLNIDAQMMTALVTYWQTGEWPRSDMRRLMRQYGLIDPEKTDVELDEELDVNPPGLNLGDE